MCDDSVDHDVNEVRLDVVEQPLVVRDDETARLRSDAVDAFGNDAQCIDVKARVGLIEERKVGFEQEHL